MISDVKTQQKALEEDVKLKRGAFALAKKEFKEIRMKKSKADQHVCSEVQNILENFGISSAAYHGRDLNGVCARCLMANS
jgi:hypothetical protein